MNPKTAHWLRIGTWIIIALLCLPCAEILACWGYFDGLVRGYGPATACLYAGLFLALVIAIGHWLSHGERDARFLGRGALIAVLLAGLAWAMQDEPAAELRYTRDMLRVPAEVEHSRPILMTYTVGGTNSVPSASKELLDTMAWDDAGKSDELPDLTPFAAEIDRLWVELLPARQVIEHLDTFPGICELSNDMVLDASLPLPKFVEWKRLVQGYSAYAILKAEQGNAAEGVRELAKLHSVSRKWLPYSTVLICRMINIEMINREIWTAQRILRTGKAQPDALAMLERAFTPLSDEDVSVRRSTIGECLAIQGTLEKINRPPDVRRLLAATGPDKPWWVVRVEQIAIAFLPFKKNASIAYLHRLYAPIIDADNIGKRPPTQAPRSWRSRRNAVGEAFISRVAMPDFDKAWWTCRKVKIRSDLLNLEIARRAGRPAEMRDWHTGKSYLYDDTAQCYFSAGKDSVPGTADDVRIGR